MPVADHARVALEVADAGVELREREAQRVERAGHGLHPARPPGACGRAAAAPLRRAAAGVRALARGTSSPTPAASASSRIASPQRGGERVEVGQGVVVADEPEVDAAVVGHHRDAERGVLGQRDERIELAQPAAEQVERDLRPGHVRHREVEEALARLETGGLGEHGGGGEARQRARCARRRPPARTPSGRPSPRARRGSARSDRRGRRAAGRRRGDAVAQRAALGLRAHGDRDHRLEREPAGSSPWRSRCVRSAPATTASTTSLTVPPSAALIALKSARSPSTHAKRRCGPIRTLSGERGAPSSPARASAPRPRTAAAPEPRRAADARPRRRSRGPARPGCRRARPRRRSSSIAPDGSGRGTHGSAGGAGGGSGSRSNSTVGDVDAGDAVDEAVVRLGDDREAVLADALDEPELPQRLRAVEPLGEDAAGERPQLVLARRWRERRVADVVVGVEVRVVDPDRPRLAQRRERELLPVAGDEAQPALDLSDELTVGGRLALEDEARAHVHVRAARLEGEERGVEAGEPFGSGHLRELSPMATRRPTAGDGASQALHRRFDYLQRCV